MAVRIRLASSTCFRKQQYSRTPGIPNVFVWAPTVTTRRSYSTVKSSISQEFPSQTTDSQVITLESGSTEVAVASRYFALRLICHAAHKKKRAVRHKLKNSFPLLTKDFQKSHLSYRFRDGSIVHGSHTRSSCNKQKVKELSVELDIKISIRLSKENTISYLTWA